MTIDWPIVQKRLAPFYTGRIDGDAGPLTYAALLGKVAGRAIPTTISAPMATHLPVYCVDASVDRLAAWIGQTAHESSGYVYTREIWGPTAEQKRYDQPGNTLGNLPGDGYAMRGAGWIEVTGRHWFDVIGTNLGIDLIGHPELASEPEYATLISLEWWRLNNANVVADTGDVTRMTRLVNGGTNGLAQRVAYTNAARAVLA